MKQSNLKIRVCGTCNNAESDKHSKGVWCQTYQAWQDADALPCRFYEPFKYDEQ